MSKERQSSRLLLQNFEPWNVSLVTEHFNWNWYFFPNELINHTKHLWNLKSQILLFNAPSPRVRKLYLCNKSEKISCKFSKELPPMWLSLCNEHLSKLERICTKKNFLKRSKDIFLARLWGSTACTHTAWYLRKFVLKFKLLWFLNSLNLKVSFLNRKSWKHEIQLDGNN